MEKIVEQIRKLLALAGNNPSEKEAMSAALKAQSMMAKYNIDISEVEDTSVDEEIVSEYCNKGNGNTKWKAALAAIISKNFRVKFFSTGDGFAFYGYKSDAKIAKEVFSFLAAQGNKLAMRAYQKARYEGFRTKGIMNCYLMGFVKGIADVLEKQCVALMIITPQEVQNSFDEMTAGWRRMSTRVRYSENNGYYDMGRSDGRSLANSRAIEG